MDIPSATYLRSLPSIALLAAYLALMFSQPSHADIREMQDQHSYENALQAIIDFQNDRLEQIITQQPELLHEKDARGMTLIDSAFLHFNDDLAPQVNSDVLTFLISSNFFNQQVDRSRHLEQALTSLRFVDTHLQRTDLPEDMIFHKSRLPIVELISNVIEDRLNENDLDSDQSLEILLSICAPHAYVGVEEQILSAQVVNAIKDSITPVHYSFISTYISTGTLDGTCIEQILK